MSASGEYILGFETQADDPTASDNDFDDALIHIKSPSPGAKTAEVWAEKGTTGRELTLKDYKGRILAANFTTTPHFQAPVLWGSFGMNLSASYGANKPWHVLLCEYNDSSAVTEMALGVKGRISNGRDRYKSHSP